MSTARSTVALQQQAAGLLQPQQQQCSQALLGRPFGRAARRAGSSRNHQSTARTVLKVEAIAAPEQAAAGAPSEFRAWDSPSAKQVAKRTDLQK